jgi:hypothetical protein
VAKRKVSRLSTSRESNNSASRDKVRPFADVRHWIEVSTGETFVLPLGR